MRIIAYKSEAARPLECQFPFAIFAFAKFPIAAILVHIQFWLLWQPLITSSTSVSMICR
ncbi:hypothetical protein NYA22BAC_03429 (plasmid) [Parasphingorhabdus sp. NYA22]